MTGEKASRQAQINSFEKCALRTQNPSRWSSVILVCRLKLRRGTIMHVQPMAGAVTPLLFSQAQRVLRGANTLTVAVEESDVRSGW